MAIINITAADVLRSKNLEAGWRSFIIKVEGPKPSKDAKSLNYVVTHTLIGAGPDLDGKEITEYFNSQFISKFIPLLAAVRGVPVASIEPKDFQFDTDELQDKKVDGEVAVDVYQGNPKNVITNYMPYGKGVAGPSF